MPFCRSAPVSPGTESQGTVWCDPPPTGGRERSSPPIGPASPPQCAGCADSTGAATVPWPVGLLIPSLSKHRFWVPSGRPLRACSPGSWPQEFRIMDVGPSHRHAQGSARRVDQDAQKSLAPSFAPVGGVASNWLPPKTGLAHGAVRRLPFPCPLRPVLRSPPPEQPRCPPALQAVHPALEGPVDRRAVVSQFPVAMTVPLAATAHPEDQSDAVPGASAWWSARLAPVPWQFGGSRSRITG